MHTRFIKVTLLALTLTSPLIAYGDDTPPDLIILNTPKVQKKKAPSRHNATLTYISPEACLSTTMSYTYAVIEAADSDGNVYSSTMVTPEEPCGLISLEPSSTITVTFDNGASLQGSY